MEKYYILREIQTIVGFNKIIYRRNSPLTMNIFPTKKKKEAPIKFHKVNEIFAFL